MLEGLKGSELASAVDALSRMRSRAPLWASSRLKMASEKDVVRKEQPDQVDLSTTIRGLTKMRQRPGPSVFRAFEAAVIKNPQGLDVMDAQACSSMLASLASIRQPLATAALECIQDRAMTLLDDLSALDVANLVLMLVYSLKDNVPMDVLDRCHLALESKLRTAAAFDVHIVMMAFKKTEYLLKPNDRLLTVYADILSDQLDSLSPGQLIRIMDGLSELKFHGEGGFWERLLERTSGVLPGADHVDMAIMTRALERVVVTGVLDYVPRPFLQPYLSRLRRLAPRFGPSALIAISQSLARFLPTLPYSVMGSFIDRVRYLLLDFQDDPEGLARVVINLSRLGKATFDEELLQGLSESLALHGERMPMKSVLVVLEALAEQKYPPSPEVWMMLDQRMVDEDLDFRQKITMLWSFVMMDDPKLWPFGFVHELVAAIGVEAGEIDKLLLHENNDLARLRTQQVLLAAQYSLIPFGLSKSLIQRLVDIVKQDSEGSFVSRSQSLIRIGQEIQATLESVELPCAPESDERYPGLCLSVSIAAEKKQEPVEVAVVVHGCDPPGVTSFTERLLRQQHKSTVRNGSVLKIESSQWRAALRQGVAQHYLLQSFVNQGQQLPSWCDRLVVEPRGMEVEQQATDMVGIEIFWRL